MVFHRELSVQKHLIVQLFGIVSVLAMVIANGHSINQVQILILSHVYSVDRKRLIRSGSLE